MSSIINSYGSYTFPSVQQRAAFTSLEERSHLINELFAMSHAPLKQTFKEEPIDLLARTLDSLPDISDIAKGLYSDSTLEKKPRSIKERDRMVNALTLPILNTPLKDIITKKPALENAFIIQERCKKAIAYLYPRTLANHPWLAKENPPMPEDTEFFVQAALNGSKPTYGNSLTEEEEEVLHLIQPLSLGNRCYISKRLEKGIKSQGEDLKKSLIEERVSNLLFAQTSNNITRVKAITETEIILEHLKGGDLFDILYQEGLPIAPEQFQAFCITLVDAFIEIESKGFCHSDLKPENIFLSEDLNSVKLGDLGLTHPLTEKRLSGSPHYCAPEIRRHQRGNSTASDVFGFGIILYNYLYKQLPEELELTSTNTSIDQIITNTRINQTLYKKYFEKLREELLADSDEFKDAIIDNKFRSLIIECLAFNPEGRPTWQSIKEILST